MATVNKQVQSGNNIIAMFGGHQIGLLQNVSMQDDYGPEPASGIGDIHVQEYVPTMARHTISVTGLVVRRRQLREALKAAGVVTENGDAALAGLVIDIVVADKETSEILRQYRGCSYASGSMDVQKHAITVQSAQYYALDVSDGS